MIVIRLYGLSCKCSNVLCLDWL